MEIVNPYYYSKIYASVFLIETAWAKHPNQLLLSYNGGKDSTVLLEIIERISLKVPIVYFKERENFPELEHFVLRRLEQTKLPVMIKSHRVLEEMTSLVKEGYSGVILGQRATDPACPKSPFMMSSGGWPAFVRINPLFEWSYRDVWQFLKLTNVDVCSLYLKGYTSLGAMGKTFPNSTLGGKPAWELTDYGSERTGRT